MKKPTHRPVDEFADTLSLDDAARRLGITRHMLKRKLGQGELPFVEIRGRIRVPSKVAPRERPH